MGSREKIKDAYEKLDCFNNPVLSEISDQLKDSYREIFGQGIDEIIKGVAIEYDVKVEQIKSSSRNQTLVHCRYLIAKQAYGKYTYQQIADALNRDHSTIVYLVKECRPPAKFTS